MDDNSAEPLVYRVSKMAYIPVLLLLFCVMPFAPSFHAGLGDSGDEGGVSTPGNGIHHWAFWLVFLIPLIAFLAVARTATVVTSEGITVRAVFGSRHLPWDRLRGLSVTGRSVYAVGADGAYRLPNVRQDDLHDISVHSGNHLPEVDRAPYRYLPKPERPIYVKPRAHDSEGAAPEG